MAKKKTQFKRHSFSAEHMGAVVTPMAAKSANKASSAANISTNDVIVTSINQYDYVKTDLRRVLILGGGGIVALFILWGLFTHTSLGSTVYGWVTF